MTNGCCKPMGLWPFETPQAPFLSESCAFTQPYRCLSRQATNQHLRSGPQPTPLLHSWRVCFSLVPSSSPMFVFLSRSFYKTTPNVPLFFWHKLVFEIQQSWRCPSYFLSGRNCWGMVKLYWKWLFSCRTRWRGHVPALSLNSTIVRATVQIYPALSIHFNLPWDKTPLNNSNESQVIVLKC